jgi:hypothetical protein
MLHRRSLATASPSSETAASLEGEIEALLPREVLGGPISIKLALQRYNSVINIGYRSRILR